MGLGGTLVKNEILIFGASRLGHRTYEILKTSCSILGFVDNDSKQWNKNIYSSKILSPQVLKDIDNKIMVVIASQYYEEIVKQLDDMGIYNYILSPLLNSAYNENLRRYRLILTQSNCIDKCIISMNNDHFLKNKKYIEDKILFIENIANYFELVHYKNLNKNIRIIRAYIIGNKDFEKIKLPILETNENIKYLIKKYIFEQVSKHWYELI